MNILLLNSARKWIGEAAHTYWLARCLARQGHKVVVGVRAGCELDAKMSAVADVSTVPFYFNSRFHLVKDTADKRLFQRIVKENAIDIVHANRGKDHWLAAASLRGNKIPLLRTRHVVMPSKNHFFNRWLFNRATSIILGVSDKTLDSVRPLIASNGPELKRILSAVDLEIFNAEHRSEKLRTEHGVAPDELWIGLVGRFQSIKGQRFFLDAAGQIANKFPQTKFILAGSGSEEKRDNYIKQAEKLGFADRLTILGRVENIGALMASLDIGVIASKGSEGSSRVALELMASKVSVIATTVGGIPELLQDSNAGILIEPQQPDQIAAQLEKLIPDSELRKKMSQAGRQHVEKNFNFNRWTNDHEEIYKSLIK